jgi:hypothetical protein
MKKTILIVMSTLLLSSTAAYSESDKSKYVDNFDLKPVVFDSERTESSNLGLDFNIDGKLINVKFSSDEGNDINPDVVIGGYDITYFLKGLLAENSDKNPKDFLEGKLSANYFRSSTFTFKAGVFVKSESDQEFNNHQLAYGLTATFANMDNFAKNDVLALQVNIGQVDPAEDSTREAILGEDPDTYNRADIEFLYIYNIGTEYIDTFEVDFRYFYEIDADLVIKDADLDIYRFVTFRLGFKNNLYIAYSSGELPFNQKDNQIYEVGFSYKFE